MTRRRRGASIVAVLVLSSAAAANAQLFAPAITFGAGVAPSFPLGNAALGGALATCFDVDASSPLVIDALNVTLIANTTGPFTFALSLNSTDAATGAPRFAIQSFPALTVTQTFVRLRATNVSFFPSFAAWPPLFTSGRYSLVLSCTSGCSTGAWGLVSQLAWLPLANASSSTGASAVAMPIRGRDRFIPAGGVAQSTSGAFWGTLSGARADGSVPPLAAFVTARALTTLVDTTRGLTAGLGANAAGSPWATAAILSSPAMRAGALIAVDNSPLTSGWPRVTVETVTVITGTATGAPLGTATLQLSLFAVSPTTLLPTSLIGSAVRGDYATNVATSAQYLAVTFNVSQATTTPWPQLVPGQLYALVLSSSNTFYDYWRAVDPAVCDGNGTSAARPSIRVLGMLRDSPGWSVRLSNPRDYTSCPSVFIGGNANPSVAAAAAPIADYTASISTAAASATTAGSALASAPALYPGSTVLGVALEFPTTSTSTSASTIGATSASSTAVHTLASVTLGLWVSTSLPGSAGSHTLNVTLSLWEASNSADGGDALPLAPLPFASAALTAGTAAVGRVSATLVIPASPGSARVSSPFNVTIPLASMDTWAAPLAAGARYGLAVSLRCVAGTGCSDATGSTLTVRWASGGLVTSRTAAEWAAAATRGASLSLGNASFAATPVALWVGLSNGSLPDEVSWASSTALRAPLAVAPSLQLTPVGPGGPRFVYADSSALLHSWDAGAAPLLVGAAGRGRTLGELAVPFAVPLSSRAGRLDELTVLVAGAAGGAAADGADGGVLLTASLWAADASTGAPTVRLLGVPAAATALIAPSVAASASAAAPVAVTISFRAWPPISAGTYALVFSATPALAVRPDGGPLPDPNGAQVLLAAASTTTLMAQQSSSALLRLRSPAMRRGGSTLDSGSWSSTTPTEAALPALLLLGGAPSFVEGATARAGLSDPLHTSSLELPGVGPALPRVDTSFSLLGWRPDVDEGGRSGDTSTAALVADPSFSSPPLGLILGPESIGRACAILLAVDGSAAGGGALFIESFSILIAASLGNTASEAVSSLTITASLWSVDPRTMTPRRPFLFAPRLTTAPVPNSLAGGRPVVVSFHPGAVGGWPAFSRGRFALVFSSSDTTGSIRWVAAAQPSAAAASDFLLGGMRVLGGCTMVPGSGTAWRFGASTTPSAAAASASALANLRAGVSASAAFSFEAALTGTAVAPNTAALMSPAWAPSSSSMSYTGSPLGTLRLLASSATLLYDGTDGLRRLSGNIPHLALGIYYGAYALSTQGSGGAVYRVTSPSPIRLTRFVYWGYLWGNALTANSDFFVDIYLANPSTGLPTGGALAIITMDLAMSTAAVNDRKAFHLVGSVPAASPVILAPNATIALVARHTGSVNTYCTADAATNTGGGALALLNGITGSGGGFTKVAASTACGFMVVGTPTASVLGADTSAAAAAMRPVPSAPTFNLSLSGRGANSLLAVAFAADQERATTLSSAQFRISLPGPGLWSFSATLWNASASRGAIGEPVARLEGIPAETASVFGPAGAIYPLQTTLSFNWSSLNAPIATMDAAGWGSSGVSGDSPVVVPLSPVLMPASLYALVVSLDSAPSQSLSSVSSVGFVMTPLNNTAVGGAAAATPLLSVVGSFNGSSPNGIQAWSAYRSGLTLAVPSLTLLPGPPAHFIVDTASGFQSIAKVRPGVGVSGAAATAVGTPLRPAGVSIAFAVPRESSITPSALSLILANAGQSSLAVALQASLFAADPITGVPLAAATNAGNASVFISVPAQTTALLVRIPLGFAPVITGGAAAAIVVTSNVTTGDLVWVLAADAPSTRTLGSPADFLGAASRDDAGAWQPFAYAPSSIPAAMLTGTVRWLVGSSGEAIVADNTHGGMLVDNPLAAPFRCMTSRTSCGFAIMLEIPSDTVYHIESLTLWTRSESAEDLFAITSLKESTVAFELFEAVETTGGPPGADEASLAPSAVSLSRTAVVATNERSLAPGLPTARGPDELTNAALGAGITPLRWTSLSKGIVGDGSGGLLLPPLRGRRVAIVVRPANVPRNVTLLAARPIKGDATGAVAGLPFRIIGGAVATQAGWSRVSKSVVPAITLSARPVGAVALDTTKGLTMASSDALITPSYSSPLSIAFRTDPFDDVKLSAMYLTVTAGSNARTCLAINLASSPQPPGSFPEVQLSFDSYGVIVRGDLSAWSALPRNTTQRITLACTPPGFSGPCQCPQGVFVYRSLAMLSNHSVDGLFTLLASSDQLALTYVKRIPAFLLLADAVQRPAATADAAQGTSLSLSLPFSDPRLDDSASGLVGSTGSQDRAVALGISFYLDDEVATAALSDGLPVGAGSDPSSQPVTAALSIVQFTAFVNVSCPGAFRLRATLWSTDSLSGAPLAPLTGVPALSADAVLTGSAASAAGVRPDSNVTVALPVTFRAEEVWPPLSIGTRRALVISLAGGSQAPDCLVRLQTASLQSPSARAPGARAGTAANSFAFNSQGVFVPSVSASSPSVTSWSRMAASSPLAITTARMSLSTGPPQALLLDTTGELALPVPPAATAGVVLGPGMPLAAQVFSSTDGWAPGTSRVPAALPLGRLTSVCVLLAATIAPSTTRVSVSFWAVAPDPDLTPLGPMTELPRMEEVLVVRGGEDPSKPRTLCFFLPPHYRPRLALAGAHALVLRASGLLRWLPAPLGASRQGRLTARAVMIQASGPGGFVRLPPEALAGSANGIYGASGALSVMLHSEPPRPLNGLLNDPARTQTRGSVTLFDNSWGGNAFRPLNSSLLLTSGAWGTSVAIILRTADGSGASWSADSITIYLTRFSGTSSPEIVGADRSPSITVALYSVDELTGLPSVPLPGAAAGLVPAESAIALGPTDASQAAGATYAFTLAGSATVMSQPPILSALRGGAPVALVVSFVEMWTSWGWRMSLDNSNSGRGCFGGGVRAPSPAAMSGAFISRPDRDGGAWIPVTSGCPAVTVTGKRLGGGGVGGSVLAFDNTRGLSGWGKGSYWVMVTDGTLRPVATVFNYTGTAPAEITRVYAFVNPLTANSIYTLPADCGKIWLELWSVTRGTGGVFTPSAALAGSVATAAGATFGTRVADPVPPDSPVLGTSALLMSWSLPPGWWPVLQPGQQYALAIKGIERGCANSLQWVQGLGGASGGIGSASARGAGLLVPLGMSLANSKPQNTYGLAGDNSLVWATNSFTDGAMPSALVMVGPPSSSSLPQPGRPALDSISSVTRTGANVRVTSSTAGAAVGPVGSSTTPIGLGVAVLFQTVPNSNSTADLALPLQSLTLAVNVSSPAAAGLSVFTISAAIFDTVRRNGASVPSSPLPGFSVPVSTAFFSRLNDTASVQRLTISIPAGSWPPLPASASRPYALVLTCSEASTRISLVFGAASNNSMPAPSAASLGSYGFSFVGVTKRLGVAGWSSVVQGPLPGILLTAGLPSRVLIDTTARLAQPVGAGPSLYSPPALPLGPDLTLATAGSLAGDGGTNPAGNGDAYRGVGAAAFVLKAGAMPLAITSITIMVAAKTPGPYTFSAVLLSADYWSKLPMTELAAHWLGPRVFRSLLIDSPAPTAVTFELDAHAWPTLQLGTFGIAVAVNESSGAVSWLMAANDTATMAANTWLGGSFPLGMAQQGETGGYSIALPTLTASQPLIPAIYIAGFSPQSPGLGNVSVLADTTAGGVVAAADGVALGAPGETPGAASVSFVVESALPVAIETISLPLLLSSRASGVALRLSLFSADSRTSLPTTPLAIFAPADAALASSMDAKGASGWRSAAMTTFWPQVGRWPLLMPGTAYSLVVSTVADSSAAGLAAASLSLPIVWAFAPPGAQNPGALRLLSQTGQRARVGGNTWWGWGQRTSTNNPGILITGSQPSQVFDNTAGFNRLLLNGVAGVVPATGSAMGCALMLSVANGTSVFVDRVSILVRSLTALGAGALPSLEVRTISDIGNSRRSPTTTALAAYPSLLPVASYAFLNTTANWPQGGDGYSNTLFTFSTSSWPALPVASLTPGGLGCAITMTWSSAPSTAVLFPGALPQTPLLRHPNVTYIGFATQTTSTSVWSQELASGATMQGNALLLSLREPFLPAAPSVLPSPSTSPTFSPSTSLSPTATTSASFSPSPSANASAAVTPSTSATASRSLSRPPSPSPASRGGPSAPPLIMAAAGGGSAGGSGALDSAYGFYGLVFTSSATGAVFSLDVTPYGSVRLYDNSGASIGSCGDFAGWLLSTDNSTYTGQFFTGGSICYPPAGGAPVQRRADVLFDCAPISAALSVDLAADGCSVVARVATPLVCGVNLTVGFEAASPSATVTASPAPSGGPSGLASAFAGQTYSGLSFTWTPPSALGASSGVAYTVSVAIAPYANVTAVFSLPDGFTTPSGSSAFTRNFGSFSGFLTNGREYTGQQFSGGAPCSGGSSSASAVFTCDADALNGPQLQSGGLSADGCALTLVLRSADVCNADLRLPDGIAVTLSTASGTATPFAVAQVDNSNDDTVPSGGSADPFASPSPFAGPRAFSALTGNCYRDLPFAIPGAAVNYSATICLGASVTIKSLSSSSPSSSLSLLAGLFAGNLVAGPNYVGQRFDTGGDSCGAGGARLMSSEVTLVCAPFGAQTSLVFAAADGGPCRFYLTLSSLDFCGIDTRIGQEWASTSNTPSISFSATPSFNGSAGGGGGANASLPGTPSPSRPPSLTASLSRSLSSTASTTVAPSLSATPPVTTSPTPSASAAGIAGPAALLGALGGNAGAGGSGVGGGAIILDDASRATFRAVSPDGSTVSELLVNGTWFGRLMVSNATPALLSGGQAPAVDYGGFAGWVTAGGSYAGFQYSGGDPCTTASGGAVARRSATVSFACGPLGSANNLTFAALDASGCVLSATIASPLFCTSYRLGQEFPSLYSMTPSSTAAVTGTASPTAFSTPSPSRRPPGGPSVLTPLLDLPILLGSTAGAVFTDPVSGRSFALNASWFGSASLVDPASPSTTILSFGTFSTWATARGLYSGLVFSTSGGQAGGLCSPLSGGLSPRSATISLQCGSRRALVSAVLDSANCTLAATVAVPEVCGVNLFVGQEVPPLYSVTASPSSASTITPSTSVTPGVAPACTGGSNAQGPLALAALDGRPLADGTFVNPVDGRTVRLNATYFGRCFVVDVLNPSIVLADFGTFATYALGRDGSYAGMVFTGGDPAASVNNGTAIRRAATITFECLDASNNNNTGNFNNSVILSGTVDAAMTMLSAVVATPDVCGVNLMLGQEAVSLFSITATATVSRSFTSTATRSNSGTVRPSPTSTKSPSISRSNTPTATTTSTQTPPPGVSPSSTPSSSPSASASRQPPSTFVVFNLTIAGCASGSDPSVSAALVALIADAAGVDRSLVAIDSSKCESSTNSSSGSSNNSSVPLTSLSFSIGIPPEAASQSQASLIGGLGGADDSVLSLLGSVAITNKLEETFSDPVAADAALADLALVWAMATNTNLTAASFALQRPGIKISAVGKAAAVTGPSPLPDNCTAASSASSPSSPSQVTVPGFFAGAGTMLGLGLAATALAAALGLLPLPPGAAAALSKCCCKALPGGRLGRLFRSGGNPEDILDEAFDDSNGSGLGLGPDAVGAPSVAEVAGGRLAKVKTLPFSGDPSIDSGLSANVTNLASSGKNIPGPISSSALPPSSLASSGAAIDNNSAALRESLNGGNRNMTMNHATQQARLDTDTDIVGQHTTSTKPTAGRLLPPIRQHAPVYQGAADNYVGSSTATSAPVSRALADPLDALLSGEADPSELSIPRTFHSPSSAVPTPPSSASSIKVKVSIGKHRASGTHTATVSPGISADETGILPLPGVPASLV